LYTVFGSGLQLVIPIPQKTCGRLANEENS
jgi:hypothetical protein